MSKAHRNPHSALAAICACAAAAAMTSSVCDAAPVPSSELVAPALANTSTGAGGLFVYAPNGTATTLMPGTDNASSTSALDGGREAVFDAAGNLYVEDSREERIYEIAAGTGAITSLSIGVPATGLAYANNTLYLTSYGLSSGQVGDISLSGGNISNDSYATYANIAGTSSTWGVTADSTGNLYIASGSNIIEVSAGANATTAGTVNTSWSGSALSNANYYYPTISNGTLYVTSHNSSSSYIAEFSLATGGTGSVYAGSTSTNTIASVYGIVFDANNNLFVVDANGAGGDSAIQQVVSGGASPDLSTFIDDGTTNYGFMGLAIAVPEPTSIILVGLGAMAIACRRVRRKA